MENDDICRAHGRKGVTAAGAGGDELGPSSRSHECGGDQCFGHPPPRIPPFSGEVLPFSDGDDGDADADGEVGVRVIALLTPYVQVTSHWQTSYRCSHGIFLILRNVLGYIVFLQIQMSKSLPQNSILRIEPYLKIRYFKRQLS